MVIYLSASRGHGEIAVAGVARDAVDRVSADIVAALCDPEAGDDLVAVTFWAQTAGAPMNPRRRIVAPSWEEIAANYPGAGSWAARTSAPRMSSPPCPSASGSRRVQR